VAVVGPAIMNQRAPAPLFQHEQHAAGQLVEAPNINTLPVDNSMLRIVTVGQQFMAELNGVVSEEEKIVAIDKNCLKSHEASPD
jgi:hypothetical protein